MELLKQNPRHRTWIIGAAAHLQKIPKKTPQKTPQENPSRKPLKKTLVFRLRF
jgi:hypothetical protein